MWEIYISSTGVFLITAISTTRRTFLALSGTTLALATSGCAGLTGERSPTITITNGFDRETTVVLDIHHATEEFPAYKDTFTLAADESEQTLNPMSKAGKYKINVVVEDTFDESYEWTVSENGPPSLRLDIRLGGMELSDAGR